MTLNPFTMTKRLIITVSLWETRGSVILIFFSLLRRGFKGPQWRTSNIVESNQNLFTAGHSWVKHLEGIWGSCCLLESLCTADTGCCSCFWCYGSRCWRLILQAPGKEPTRHRKPMLSLHAALLPSTVRASESSGKEQITKASGSFLKLRCSINNVWHNRSSIWTFYQTKNRREITSL